MQGEFEIDRIFRLDLSDYAHSDSDYEPPKQRGDFLELSEDEYELHWQNAKDYKLVPSLCVSRQVWWNIWADSADSKRP